MSPLQVQLFIDACVCAGPVRIYSNYTSGTVVHKTCLDELACMGLLVEPDEAETFEDRIYRPTEKGRAYLQFLCSLPLPVSNWTIPGPWAPSFPPSEAA